MIILEDIDRAATDIVQTHREDDWALYVAISQALLSERTSTRTWRPIETAPTSDKGRDILVWDGSVCDVVSVGWWEGDKPVWFNGDVRVDATHWMPLPESPIATAIRKGKT